MLDLFMYSLSSDGESPRFVLNAEVELVMKPRYPTSIGNTLCCIVICWFIQKYTYIYWIHTDAMNNRRNDKDGRKKTSSTTSTSHFIATVRKGCVGFFCERELEIEHNCNILTHKLMAVNFVSFSFFWCSTGALGSTLLGASFLYCILSASSLDPNSSGLFEGPFGRVWLSLLHLSPTPSDLQLHWLVELNWVI